MRLWESQPDSRGFMSGQCATQLQQLSCVGSGARLLESELVLPLPSCVTLGKLHNFSLP